MNTYGQALRIKIEDMENEERFSEKPIVKIFVTFLQACSLVVTKSRECLSELGFRKDIFFSFTLFI